MLWNIWHWQKLDTACFLIAPGLRWKAAFKKKKIKCKSINWYQFVINDIIDIRGYIYMKDCDKNKESSIYLKYTINHLEYLDVNNLYGLAMLQKFILLMGWSNFWI